MFQWCLRISFVAIPPSLTVMFLQTLEGFFAKEFCGDAVTVACILTARSCARDVKRASVSDGASALLVKSADRKSVV